MDYYVYLHRKKTTGEVFYVGKGCKGRAWTKHGRSIFWKRIVKKHGFLVEIVASGLREWYSFELEKELIAYHGRIDTKTGTLINFTDGGEGGSGLVRSPEYLKMQAERVTGILNPSSDKANYNFCNCRTLETFTGTRSEFKEKYKISANSLFRSEVSHTLFGWYLPDTKSEKEIGELTTSTFGKLIHHDRNSYSLVNLLNNEVFTGTRLEFKKKYLVGINGLFKTNPYLIENNWALLDVVTQYGHTYLLNRTAGMLNPSADRIIYDLFNYKTKERVQLTRTKFKEVYGVSISDLIKSDYNFVGDWCLYDKRHLAPELYRFEHIDGSFFSGTRSDFKKKFGFYVHDLFRVGRPAKSVKGWRLVKPNQLAISEPTC